MDRNYTTTHKGIAAYLLLEGYELVKTTMGKNPKTGKPNCRMEFKVDAGEGRKLGDAFFDGHVDGDLKKFYDAVNTIGHEIYLARGGQQQ